MLQLKPKMGIAAGMMPLLMLIALCTVLWLKASSLCGEGHMASLKAWDRQSLATSNTFVSSMIKDLQLGGSTNSVEKLLAANGEGRRVVDIGLLDGQETLLAAQNGFKVLAVDPVTKYIQDVARKLQDLGIDHEIYNPDRHDAKEQLKACLAKRVCLVNAALGNSSFISKVHLESGGTSLVDHNGVSGDFLETKVVPLDSLIEEDVFLYKVDVQGYELFVFQGSSQLFKNHAVQYIAMEFFPRGIEKAGYSYFDLLSFLQVTLHRICFDVNSGSGFTNQHPETLVGYVDFVTERRQERDESRFGIWDDFLCIKK